MSIQKEGTESLCESGVKWRSGRAKRPCDRTVNHAQGARCERLEDQEEPEWAGRLREELQAELATEMVRRAQSPSGRDLASSIVHLGCPPALHLGAIYIWARATLSSPRFTLVSRSIIRQVALAGLADGLAADGLAAGEGGA